MFLQEVREASIYDPSAAELTFLTTWIFAIPCCLHDGHNAFRWAMADCMDDDLLKEVYIGNESCLNSYHQILDAMPSWLAVVLRPMPRNELPSAEAPCAP